MKKTNAQKAAEIAAGPLNNDTLDELFDMIANNRNQLIEASYSPASMDIGVQTYAANPDSPIAGKAPFFSFVRHPAYNDSAPVVAAEYQTEKEARDGHKTWAAVILGPAADLPASITEMSTAPVAALAAAKTGPLVYERKGI